MFRAEWDDNDLRQLEVDLSNAPRRVQFGATEVLVKGARLVARGMHREVGGHRFLRHLPKTVSHELITPFIAEIGMEKSRTQGRLAHIMAYGSVNNAPVFDHVAPLRKATPRVVDMFADMGEEAMLGDDQ